MGRARPLDVSLTAIEKLDEIMHTWCIHRMPITYSDLVEVRALMESKLYAPGVGLPSSHAEPLQGAAVRWRMSTESERPDDGV